MTSKATAARLLGRIGPKLAHNVAQSRGGVPEYTWENICGAMAGLPQHQQALLRMAYSLERVDPRPIIERAHTELTATREVRQWRQVPEGALARLIATAVAEHVAPSARLCSTCAGLGDITPPNAVRVQCSACAGTGVKSLPGAVLARAIGVSPASWSEVWRVRYTLVYNHVGDWMQDALRHVAGRL